MNRRDFLRSTTLATVGGMAVRGMSSPLMAALANSTVEDRVLVVVQLFGGNDGLNTVIPLDQYSLLSGFRSQVIIPDTDVLLLSGTGNATGLHPAMSGLMDLWNDDKLTIVQGVGYPDPNYSHFRATDIWETGSGSDTVLSSGWGGRYLNLEYPNYPVGFPNAQMPDPLAIRIGGPVSVGLQHMGVNMGIAINNTNDPLNLAGNIYLDPVSADCSGGKLDFVRTVQRQADDSPRVSALRDMQNLATRASSAPLQAKLGGEARPADGESLGTRGGLPGSLRGKMERSFGVDFGDVTIRTNSSKAGARGALAVTQGSDHWSYLQASRTGPGLAHG